jgi:hypothetical protein
MPGGVTAAEGPVTECATSAAVALGIAAAAVRMSKWRIAAPGAGPLYMSVDTYQHSSPLAAHATRCAAVWRPQSVTQRRSASHSVRARRQCVQSPQAASCEHRELRH